ncbi:MAG: hypothetical protein R3E89_00165 [Thiolinea sp.]
MTAGELLYALGIATGAVRTTGCCGGGAVSVVVVLTFAVVSTLGRSTEALGRGDALLADRSVSAEDVLSGTGRVASVCSWRTEAEGLRLATMVPPLLLSDG